MSRRVNPTKRSLDGGVASVSGLLHQKARFPPLLCVTIGVVGVFLLIGYLHSGSGIVGTQQSYARVEGGASCTPEVIRAFPILRKVYGDSMQKVLHVGPDTCSIVSNLLKEGNAEVWGVEPYDLEDADTSCKSLVRKGFVRVADVKFRLPYRPNSFNLVVVSDTLDYLTLRYLNKTLPDLARVASDGIVIFTGTPGLPRAKDSQLMKFGRPAKLRSSSWWIRYFIQLGLAENAAPTKKFEQAAAKLSYQPGCQIFHLSS